MNPRKFHEDSTINYHQVGFEEVENRSNRMKKRAAIIEVIKAFGMTALFFGLWYWANR